MPIISNEAVANRILLALPPQVLKDLTPHLKMLDLQQGWVVCLPDQPVRAFYFINRGIVSLIKRMKNGEAVEIGARGIEGLTSPELLFGVETPLYEAVVQVSGTAFAISTTALKSQFDKSRRFRVLLLAYIHAAGSQVAQTAACNRLHALEQRCCRWLLIAHDSARSDRFALTHEFLAMMLGVHRPSVSVVMKNFQDAGTLNYARGQLTIINRPELERASCECYQTIADEFSIVFAHCRPDN